MRRPCAAPSKNRSPIGGSSNYLSAGAVGVRGKANVASIELIGPNEFGDPGGKRCLASKDVRKRFCRQMTDIS